MTRHIVIYTILTVAIAVLLLRQRRITRAAVRRASGSDALVALASRVLALPERSVPSVALPAVAQAAGIGMLAAWRGEELWGSVGLPEEHTDITAAAAWTVRARSATSLQRKGMRIHVLPVPADQPTGAVAIGTNAGAPPYLGDPDFLRGVAGLMSLVWERTDAADAEIEADAAQRSDELKTALLSMVSHELRSPVTAIKATVESLGIDDEEDVEALIGQCDRMNRLVGNLLDASRIEAGQLQPVKHPVRLRRLTGELLDRMGSDARIEIPAETYVDADPVLIEQVLRNLVENAERHGRAPITISAARKGALVYVTVHDCGDGAPPDALDKLFDKFVRFSRGGLGLGLALCRAIVEAHGGTIEARNRTKSPDNPHGFEVTFTLHGTHPDR